MAELPKITMEIGEIKPQKWEYDVYYLGNVIENRYKVLEVLDAYGKGGWELVSIDDGHILFFKRPIWSE